MKNLFLVLLLAGCEVPEEGYTKTIAALGVKPTAHLCEPKHGDTCTVRFGDRIERWYCTSTLCTPGSPPKQPDMVIINPPVTGTR